MKKIAMLAIAVLTCTPYVTAYAIGDGDADGAVVAAAPSISAASYQGRTIDLSKGWGTAVACYAAEDGTTCFETEAEMDKFIAAAQPTVQPAVQPAGLLGSHGAARLSSCSSYLRLYDGISYGTPVVATNITLTVIDLSALGFDNRTTSYKVGACSANMWSGPGTSGSAYPGNTSAGAQAASMVSGWNNVMSSVYLA